MRNPPLLLLHMLLGSEQSHHSAGIRGRGWGGHRLNMRPTGEQVDWVDADVHANRELFRRESAQDGHLAVSVSRESKK